jgi:hypothetical protein
MNDDTKIGIPSKQAAMMLSQLADMDYDQVGIIHDLGLGIASTMETIAATIENPPKKIKKGCQVIYLGSQLFLPIRDLKKSLEDGELDLESYLHKLNAITDDLCEITEKNHAVMVNPNIRNHMKRLANTIVIGVEAGSILNTMFGIIDSEDLIHSD